jgi:hypothetical protein
MKKPQNKIVDNYVNEKVRVLLIAVYDGGLDPSHLIRAKLIQEYLGDNCPEWIHIIAGANYKNLEGALELARESLAFELAPYLRID